MNWIVFFILSVIMVFTPYQKGLFFDKDLYIWETIIGALFIITVILMFKKNLQHIKGTNLVVFLVPLMYLVVIPIAESPKSNMDLMYRWTAFSCFFCMLIWVQYTDKIRRLLPFVLHLCGSVIAILAITGYWGYFDFPELLTGDDRLAGTLQYPNTFATLMGAFWLYALIVLTTRQILKPWMVLFFGFPLVAFLISILLSESRGTFLILPISWFFGLLLLRTREQIKFILNTLISVGISLVVYRQIISAKEAGISNPGLISFFIGTVVVVLLITVIVSQLHTNKLRFFESKNLLRFVFPVLALMMAVLLVADLKFQGIVYHQLPTNLQERVASIDTGTASVLGRTAFYEDGIKMSKDAPLLGYGGGGWKALFTKYQHQPYWSTNAHNGYLELLLDIGWIGLLVFVVVFGMLIGQIFKRIREEKNSVYVTMTIATLPSLLTIFLHSMIDLDLSFGTIWFVVLWLLAMGVSERPLINSRVNVPWLGKVSLAVLIVFVGVLSFKSFKFYLSENQVAYADSNLSLQKGQEVYERTTFYNPYHIDYLLKLASVYVRNYEETGKEAIKTEILKTIARLVQLEPNNPKVLFGIGNLYTQIGDPLTGISYVDMALNADKFKVEYYDSSIFLKSEVALQIMEHSEEKAKELAISGINDFQRYNQLFEVYKKNPIPDMRPLNIKTITYFYVGQAYLILGEYQHSIDILSRLDGNVENHILKQVYAVRFIANEQMGKQNDNSKIEFQAGGKFPDFKQYVKNYKTKIGIK
ncbi:O-antigen ligase family protein [Ammoniphilus resinae]|uniref:O-antigen ligase/tetratricopeptide (TPR) repeat protein n=1 Tax=Ammoniphilus resinae TaxID=861532 RepID=A0ABS4GWW4_9BACL|nr:O-antigen ligase family protein [Ammoniphilus resinae]MBP1934760.1 O-antigen ligase/tetratricopeptide (TPR) repeat protein [Ammoniphilus resinae]